MWPDALSGSARRLHHKDAVSRDLDDRIVAFPLFLGRTCGTDSASGITSRADLPPLLRDEDEPAAAALRPPGG